MTGREAELEGRIELLERRLLAVEDVQAIQNLKARYGRLTDARYGREGVRPRSELEPLATDIASLFSEDAVWDAGKGLGTCRGREAIYERFLDPTLSFTWHYFVKPEIHVDGDRATGRWDILSPCTTTEGRAMWMAGVEDDSYVREGGVWLHASMKLRVVFMAPHDRGWARKPSS